MSWTNDTKPVMNTEFIMTQALDFLMTQDGDYLVTNQSVFWSNLLKTITSWTNFSK